MKIKAIGAAFVAAVWLGLSIASWVLPPRELSEAERRKLEQMPDLTVDTVLSGSFMEKFEEYTMDQFPMRDKWRQLKAWFTYDVLHQGDNNGIYIADGYAAQLEYPMDLESVSHALRRFQFLYEQYLKDTGSDVYFAIAPDKSLYLASEHGYPAMDYEALYEAVRSGVPWATFVDLRQDLQISDYYRTDTHWRQEKLFSAAQTLCTAMGVTAPAAENFTAVAAQQPFYGVYYGQAALPMDPETIYLLESSWLEACTVYNHETGKTTGIYDLEKLSGRDPYEVYLSGSAALLTIENPNAGTDRELIVFRDSFGSSMIPLLLQDYKTVTVVDIRYIAGSMLPRFVEFRGQDVLFLYSTLVLNNSSTLK